jgi:hypothetical protein
MKQVLSLFTFGIEALLFLAFLTTLKPTVVTAASGPGKPGQCSTLPLLIFATASWPDVRRQK